MADSTIEWTTKTWNPTTGCTKISKECDNCYAEDMTNRCMHMPKHLKYKLGFDVFVEHESTLSEPYGWTKPETVFVNSMSDLFHKDITLDFLKKVFKVMKETPQHTYQILTKRHHELEKYSDQLEWSDNIWMGVSVGHAAGVRRIESLVKCGAKHKFLSVEPLIEELPDLDLTGVDWVIVGGESGDSKSRPMEKEWVLKVKKNCDEQSIPFFFKQWGMPKNNPNPNDPTINKEHKYHSKGGSQLDGKIYWTNPTVEDDSMATITLFDKEYLVMDQFQDLKTIWELKSYLPFMDKELYKQLKQDIRKNGLNDPILYFTTPNGDKLVIEGHTRLKACIKLNKKKIPTKEVKEEFQSLDDVKLWMVKHQFQRRNLSPIEKIKLAYLSKDTIEKIATENLSKGGKKTGISTAIDTTLELAKIAGVGRTTITRYNTVMEKGSKELVRKMENGHISISAASSIAKKRSESKPKSKIKVSSKASFSIKMYDNIKQAEDDLKSAEIEGILILKEENQIDLCTYRQKKKFGFCIFD